MSQAHTASASYAEWIARTVPGQRDAYGTCRVMSKRMAAAFPELRLARGFYYCPIWGRREHWWCVTAAGEIVDPTAHQHPSAGRYPESALGRYEELAEDAEEPIGRCMECGEYCFKSAGGTSYACSPAHARAIEAEYSFEPKPRWP